MLLYLTLLVCTVGFGLLVYRYDLHDREPVAGVLVCVLLGAAFMWLAGRAQVAVMSGLGSSAAANWNWIMAVTAGVTEEAGKFAAVLTLALAARRWFNDPLDGLIYGSLAGLGAAVHESWIYLDLGLDLGSGSGGASRLGSLPPTEPVRLMGHLVMGGLTCAGAGWLARNRAARVPGWLLLAGAAAGITLHTLWDVIAFEASDHGRMKGWQTWCGIGLMLAGFVMYRALVSVLARKSERVFTRDAGTPPQT